MPVQWFAFADGPLEYLSFGRRDPIIKAQDGLTYVYRERVELGALPQTPTNPLGVRGTGSFWDQRGYTDSYYAAAQTDWFGDRFTTLAGYRTNNVENKRYEIGDSKRSQKSPGSLNLGANYRLNRFLRPYYGYSNAFNPPDIVQFGPHGEVAQPAHSIGHEFGLKFDPKSGFISGSVGVFTVKSKDEQVSIATDVGVGAYDTPLYQVQPCSRTSFFRSVFTNFCGTAVLKTRHSIPRRDGLFEMALYESWLVLIIAPFSGRSDL